MVSDRPAQRDHRAELALAALAFLTYAQTLGYGFVADDFEWILGNEMVRDPSTIWRAFSFGQLNNRVFRPLPLAWFTLDYTVAGSAAWFYHLENVLLHTLVTVLFYRLVCPFGRRAAWLAAALFAVLPVHTEVVANITSRSELLATALALLALLELRRPALAACLLAAAVLSKETAAVAPLLAPLLWLAPREPRECRPDGGGTPALPATRGQRMAALGALLAGLSAYTFFRLRAHCCVLFPPGFRYLQLDNPLLLAEWPARVRTAVMIIGQNIGITFVPYHLSADYSYNQIPVVQSWLEPRFILWALVPLALIGLAIIAYRTDPAVSIGAGWGLLALVPVSNLIFLIGTIRGERLLYLPSAGACLLLGRVLSRLGRGRRIWPIAVTALLLLLLGARAVDRNRVWRSQEALTAASLRDAPNSARAHFQAGALRMAAGDCAGAVPYFRRALVIFPQSEVAVNALGACGAVQGP